jgi:hypothetical protein
LKALPPTLKRSAPGSPVMDLHIQKAAEKMGEERGSGHPGETLFMPFSFCSGIIYIKSNTPVTSQGNCSLFRLLFL